MSTKDYIQVASVFADTETVYHDSPAGMAALFDAQRKISTIFAADNPRFKASVFKTACFPIASLEDAERF